MVHKILHVWRNTPFGRETLLQTAFFAHRIAAEVELIQPEHTQVLFDLDGEVVTISLDSSYLRSPVTARENAERVLAAEGVSSEWLAPTGFAAETLPSYTVKSDYLVCPRVMSDRSTRVRLGQVGSSVRHIVHSSRAPVLIPAPVFRPWERVVAFFGGSPAGTTATRLAGSVAHAAGLPLVIFSVDDGTKGRDKLSLEAGVEALRPTLPPFEWIFERDIPIEEALMDVPPNGLLVFGTFGHGLIRKRLFGSFAETLQTIMPAPLLVAGPRYRQV